MVDAVPERNPPQPGTDLVGNDPSAQQQGGSKDSARAFTSQIRDLHTKLDDVARQYPDMAENCRKAKEALTDGMVKHLGQQDQSNRAGGPPPLVAG